MYLCISTNNFSRPETTSDIFIFCRHLGLEPKKCRKLKNVLKHHLRRDSS